MGEVVSFEIHFSAANTRHLAADAWRLRPDQCPLLPVMQLGIHGLDLIHFLLGPIDEVYAFARSVTTRPEVTDSVTAALRIGDGPIGTMVSSYCTQVLFEIRIAGTDGTLRMTPHYDWFRSTEATDGRGDGPAETADFRAYDIESYARQMEVFGEALLNRVAPESDGWSGLQALAVVEALQQSIQTHAPQRGSHVPRSPPDRLTMRTLALLLALLGSLPTARSQSEPPTLYAAVVEAKTFIVGAANAPSGLHRFEGDTTWTHLGWATLRDFGVAADPHDPGTLYLAAGNGVLRCCR